MMMVGARSCSVNGSVGALRRYRDIKLELITANTPGRIEVREPVIGLLDLRQSEHDCIRPSCSRLVV